jgi:DNA-directed RNA polymerase specialized sigma24 family protein
VTATPLIRNLATLADIVAERDLGAAHVQAVEALNEARRQALELVTLLRWADVVLSSKLVTAEGTMQTTIAQVRQEIARATDGTTTRGDQDGH